MRALICFWKKVNGVQLRPEVTAPCQSIPFPETVLMEQDRPRTLYHRHYYFRFRLKPEVLMKSAPTEKWLVLHVWLAGTSIQVQLLSGLVTIMLKKLQLQSMFTVNT